MKKIKIGQQAYEFVSDYRNDPKLWQGLDKLGQAIFGFSLENWYQSGYWGEQYIPYSLLDNGELIANVSASTMEFLLDDQKLSAIQIGTVMTAETHRGRGLSRFLTEHLVGEWKEKTDFIFLFANPTVLDFYPKFNFEKMDEYQHFKLLNGKQKTAEDIRKLNMDDSNDVELLVRAIRTAVPIARLSVLQNEALIMFYCLSFMKNDVYHLPNKQAVVIASFDGDTLYLNDVFSPEAVALEEIIDSMAHRAIRKLVLGFSPKDDSGFEKCLLVPDDTLFVFKEQAANFRQWQLRFPVLSHA
ncbi:GNAT family N-acetyltransferase [Robiginitalea sp. IMCC43444]|uniref:GNAT family N-acetyltransferase n=1 Tax=Robiginitalea sp. IMCC43444 TaxID=3459121 RepID=UPI0040425CA4